MNKPPARKKGIECEKENSDFGKFFCIHKKVLESTPAYDINLDHTTPSTWLNKFKNKIKRELRPEDKITREELAYFLAMVHGYNPIVSSGENTRFDRKYSNYYTDVNNSIPNVISDFFYEIAYCTEKGLMGEYNGMNLLKSPSFRPKVLANRAEVVSAIGKTLKIINSKSVRKE
ncbi:hypothetical protein ASN18_2575 [Candidatus Magnetominusculus xianensis]|uniref:Uncharacterized protein n=1 Tax=Candidatus Magnetominusculus xianensis TaxID=1748249 RepID=A0ABR5SE82_9BACT|nr:hypothetical protein ASN18_2575 [Candidatus Magnetominusculus xianensis]